MDRYFIRDILIFLTYAGAVWWGIQIERWTHELGHAITSPHSYASDRRTSLHFDEAQLHEAQLHVLAEPTAHDYPSDPNSVETCQICEYPSVAGAAPL